MKQRYGKILQSKNYSFLDIKIWLLGYMGIVNIIRTKIYRFTINGKFDNLILLCVCTNTTVMCCDGYITDKEGQDLISTIQDIFTFVFLGELILKNISLGTLNYVRDKINLFDASLVTIGLVEYFSTTSGGVSAFRALRILRVLRITRLIRSLRYMRVIIKVVAKTIESSFYVGLLLLLLIFVYAILGMNIYSLQLQKTNG